jgi:hypothetical protein
MQSAGFDISEIMVRLKYHQPTKDYVARRTAEGKSKKDIIRCLKGYVARESSTR